MNPFFALVGGVSIGIALGLAVSRRLDHLDWWLDETRRRRRARRRRGFIVGQVR